MKRSHLMPEFSKLWNSLEKHLIARTEIHKTLEGDKQSGELSSSHNHSSFCCCLFCFLKKWRKVENQTVKDAGTKNPFCEKVTKASREWATMETIYFRNSLTKKLWHLSMMRQMRSLAKRLFTVGSAASLEGDIRIKCHIVARVRRSVQSYKQNHDTPQSWASLSSHHYEDIVYHYLLISLSIRTS